MGALFGEKKTSLEQYEAYTVLSTGVRQLAQTCVTRGARRMLQKLADQFEREAREVEGLGQALLCPATIAPRPAQRGASISARLPRGRDTRR